MDELKMLIEAVSGLPTLTIWVLLGYLVYKLAVIGSTFGIARFAIQKFVEWKTTPRGAIVKADEVACISDAKEILMGQISRLGNKQHRGYIFREDVEKLRKALDIVLEEKKT